MSDFGADLLTGDSHQAESNNSSVDDFVKLPPTGGGAEQDEEVSTTFNNTGEMAEEDRYTGTSESEAHAPEPLLNFDDSPTAPASQTTPVADPLINFGSPLAPEPISPDPIPNDYINPDPPQPSAPIFAQNEFEPDSSSSKTEPKVLTEEVEASKPPEGNYRVSKPDILGHDLYYAQYGFGFLRKSMAGIFESESRNLPP